MGANSKPKLTAEQSAAITKAAKNVVTAATSTDPIDRTTCTDVIGRAYHYLGLRTPEILFFESPTQAMAELQKRVPPVSQEKARVGSEPLSNHELSDLGALVMSMIGDAQPRNIPAFGDEVDLTFNDEMNKAMGEVYRLPIWRPLSNLVDRRLGNLIHHAHAVTTTLEQLVGYREQKWLLHSGGMSSIWNGAEGFVRVQALHDIGMIKQMPEGKVLGLAALQSCGWVNAFERLCMVCNRPSELHQTGKVTSPEGMCTQVAWRDGQVCEYVYTA